MSEMNSNPIYKLVDDCTRKANVSEIIINNPQSIFIEEDGQFVKVNVKTTVDEIATFAKYLAIQNGRTIDLEHPILDGSLSDGSRVNIILNPFSLGSPAITIRKFLKHIKRFDSSPGIFGLSPKWVMFLKTLIKAKMNFIVSGGTGVGKTTFMNLLIQEVSPDQRVITIEDTRELNFELPNVVRLEAKSNVKVGVATLSIRDLVKNTLRMRPDRIIIGECRGPEVFDLLQAMNTGHEGSFASVHSNSPAECLLRMENLFLLTGHDVPLRSVRFQIATAVDFVIQINRTKDGKRIISHISEITGMEGDKILLSELAKVSANDQLKSTGIGAKRLELLMKHGLPLDFFAQKD